MSFYILAGSGVLLVMTIIGLALTLFGRDWFRARVAARFARILDRHQALIDRLASVTATSDRDQITAELRAIDDPVMREAVLDRARGEADLEAGFALSGFYDDLGITERLEQQLHHSTGWEQRAAAAERLGRIGSIRAVPVLLAVACNERDEDPDVRDVAIRAIGRIRDPRALPRLIESLGLPQAALPPRIAEIIVRFGSDAVDLLAAELRQQGHDIRRMWSAEILGWIEDSRAVIPLLESLGDVSAEVRAKAVGALGRIADPRAVSPLLEMLLADPVPFVRTRAARALGTIGDPKVVDHLIHVLDDPEWWVRIRAIEALEMMGHDAVTALVVALQDESPEVRQRAASALERLGYVDECLDKLDCDGFRADVSKVLLAVGQAGVTQALFERLPQAVGEPRRLLVRLLGDIGNPAAGPVLLELLDVDDDPQLEARAIEALGKLRFEPAIPSLLASLHSEDAWVRQAAVGALSALDPRDHADELLKLVTDPSAPTRQVICSVLAGLDDERVSDAIARLLVDPVSEVRAEALRTVRRRTIAELAYPVSLLLFDATEDVRVEAARALTVIGGEDAVEPMFRAVHGTSDALIDAVIPAVRHCHPGKHASLKKYLPDLPSACQIAVFLQATEHDLSKKRLALVRRHLTDESAWLRRRAVLSLAGHEPAVLGRPLSRALSDPDPGVREAAITVAALSDERSLLEPVCTRVEDPTPAVRAQAALALGLGRHISFRPALITLAADAEPTVRAAAAMGLASLDDEALVTKLNELAHDADLREAAHELFVSGAPNPLAARVVELAEDEGSIETRFFMGASPVGIEKEMAQRALTALDVHERVRALEVCESVATGHSYVSALSILMHDPSPKVRSHALRIVVKCRKDAEVASLIGKVLDDPHPDLRVQAATTLAVLDFPEAISALLLHLDTDDRVLREAITTSLSEHFQRSRRFAEKLMSEIPSTHTRKLGLIWLLGKSQGKGPKKILLRHLRDDNAEVRAACVGALTRYGPDVIANHLADALADPNDRVRAAAVNAFAGLSTPEWEARITDMLCDPDEFVRRRAAVALVRMGAEQVTERIGAIDQEPAELRPVWAAGGVVLGEIEPEQVHRYPGSLDVLEELMPIADAESGVLSPDRIRRVQSLRVVRVRFDERATRIAEQLTRDPDPDVRGEADEALRLRKAA